MDLGARPTSIRTDRWPPDRHSVLPVDDLVRAIVDLLVAGADVEAVEAGGVVRILVADGRGRQLQLVQR